MTVFAHNPGPWRMCAHHTEKERKRKTLMCIWHTSQFKYIEFMKDQKCIYAVSESYKS